jgi:hypothetical protein
VGSWVWRWIFRGTRTGRGAVANAAVGEREDNEEDGIMVEL